MTELSTTRRMALGAGLASAASIAVSTLAPRGAASRAEAAATPTAPPMPDWVDIRSYEDDVPNRTAPAEDWDWTTAIQNAIDENQGRVIYFPGTAPRYLVSDYISLSSQTTLRGDGTSKIYFTIQPEDSESALVRAGFFRLREAAVIANPTGAFSTDITIADLTFECLHQQRNGIFRLVNVRRASITGCTFLNCGGAYVCHELEVNGSYDRGNPGASGDPAVQAGFSATGTDDLCEDIRFQDNRVDGVTYFVMALRLDFVRRAVVTGNICRFASISWWGGGARSGEGGEKQFLRRCRELMIAHNYLHQNNGAIYGNNGTEITVTGNTCEYSIDTAIDMEGCTDFVVDANVVRYAGNFCYSVFYGARNGVFSNNVAIQGPAAADMGDVGQQHGREVFRQIASFNDARPEQFAIRGNTFRWDGDTGFGVLRLDNYGDVAITDNHFENVLVDGIAGHSKSSQSLIDNEFRFTNATAANDVYIVLGRQFGVGRSCTVRGNRILVENGHSAAIPLLVVQHRSDGAGFSTIEHNVIDTTTSIAIGYGDLRQNNTANGQAFAMRDNAMRSGQLANLSRGGSTEIVDEGNITFDAAAAPTNHTPDTARYANLKLGLAVAP